MKRILLSIFVLALLQDAFCWISQPEPFARRSSLQFQSPMAPMDFIDVEVTGHANGSSSDKSKSEKTLTEEDKSRTKEILMPSISPTMTKGKIVEWLVRTGDTIRKGDPIMVIESEKEVQGAQGYRMNQDVNANVDGVLAAIYQQPGQAVDVGAVLGIIVPDFIIDAEIEGQMESKPEGVPLEEKGLEPAATTAAATAIVDTQADAPVEFAENESVHTKVPPSPSLMNEMMPSTPEIESVDISGAATATSGADWVHGHHASTDGMVNDNSFYSAHKTQASSSSSSGGKRNFDTSFTGGVDSRDSFYSPYPEGAGPGTMPPPSHPKPQPQPSMKPNGAGDNFYEVYQENQPSLDDPYVQQMQQWQQQSNAGNANMGDYYQAERNGQSQSHSPVEQHVVIQNPTSTLNSQPPTQTNGYNGHSNSPSSVVDPEPQEVFVKGVSPEPDSSTVANLYNNGFAQQPTRVVNEPKKEVSESTIAIDGTLPTPEPEITHVARTAASTVVSPPSAPETPVAAATTTTTQEDLEQFRAMESRITSLGDSPAISTKVEIELESLAKGLEDLKNDYDEKVQKLEDSHQTSMAELRDWDTLTVTWDIKDFEKTLEDGLTTYTSEEFNVAGYSMTMEMQIFGTNDEGSRDVGFYIMHTGGLNYVPIMIGGSKIIIQSTNGNDNDDAVKVFVDDASIEDSHYGWGWKKFFDLQDLKQSFVNDKGEIQVTTTVRVKRVRTCRINTAI